MDRYFTKKEIKQWLNPWPILLNNRFGNRWRLDIVPLKVAGQYKTFGDSKVTINTLARRIKKAEDQNLPDPADGYGHYTVMMSRDYAQGIDSLLILVSKGNRVVDGGHRLTACILAKLMGRKIKFNYVAVLKEVR